MRPPASMPGRGLVAPSERRVLRSDLPSPECSKRTQALRTRIRWARVDVHHRSPRSSDWRSPLVAWGEREPAHGRRTGLRPRRRGARYERTPRARLRRDPGPTPRAGAPPLVLGLLVAVVALLGDFIAVESRASDPLVPLHLFRTRGLTVSAIVLPLSGAAFLGMFFRTPTSMTVHRRGQPLPLHLRSNGRRQWRGAIRSSISVGPHDPGRRAQWRRLLEQRLRRSPTAARRPRRW